MFVRVNFDRWGESDGRKIFTADQLPDILTLHSGSTKVNSPSVALH